MSDYGELQKRCQRGAANLADANNLLAECYGAIGALTSEVGTLRKALTDCTASLEGEMLQKYHGHLPDDMHPVTRRDYDRDVVELNSYKHLIEEEAK